MISTLLTTFLVFGVLLLYRRLYLNRRRLPPGPKGLPLIGNLWNVPAEYPWLTYAQWAATYGDVLYLDTPGNPTVILNSAQAAADLFEKRSRNYSDRPGMVHRYYNVSELIIVRRFHHDEVSWMGEYDGEYEIFRPVEAGTIMFTVDVA